MSSVLDRPIDLTALVLSLVSRERLGPELDLDAPADAGHRARLESFGDLMGDGGDRADGGDLVDGEVLEIIAAWARQIASAHAAMLSWVQVLRERPGMSARNPHITSGEATTAELAARLGLSKRAASRMVDDAAGLTGSLWPVGEALREGFLDAGKASIFVEVLAEQSIEAVIGVTEAALPKAGGVDHSGLRRLLHRLLVQVDPDGVTDRYRAAVGRRRVNRIRPLADGMASFSAVLPAPAATALDQACEAAARGARSGGDGRTLDQLRADALATMAETALITGRIGTPDSGEVFTFDPRHARVQVIATTQAQRGQREASLGDALSWEINTPTGKTSIPREGAVPGDGAASDPDVDSGWGPSPYDGIQAPSRSRVGVDAPELVGYGPIPAAMVPGLKTQRWVVTTTPPDLSQPPPPAPGYRPTADLDRYVRDRDQTCQAPGCGVPARRCDLDHTIPYPAGVTSAGNLRALCRFHHRLKTHGGHTYTTSADGTLQWRTPTGQILTRVPEMPALTFLEGWDTPLPRVKPEDLDPGDPNNGCPDNGCPDDGCLDDGDLTTYQDEADTHAATTPLPTDPRPNLPGATIRPT